MMKFFIGLVGVALILTFLSEQTVGAPSSEKEIQEKKRYDNYQVFKLYLSSETQKKLIDSVQDNNDNYILWKEYDNRSKEVHIMVHPNKLEKFRLLLKEEAITFTVMIENVQRLIDDENVGFNKARASSFGWTSYHELHEIENWLDGILATYPQVTERFVIGQSYEKRNINGLKISHNPGKPGIFIESNIHAREWITSASATWFINELLTSENSAVRDLALNYDWYIIPVFNVDGFVYSHEKDRLWRKTRQPVTTSNCIGTDPNRNFDSYWLQNGGASDDPCSETFAGPTPFSEPEAAALAAYLTTIKDKINIYIAFHSYSQLLLSPYGHTKEEFPPNYDDLLQVGGAFSDAIVKLPYATNYTAGSTADVLYVASGSSVDWTYNELNIRIGYTIEFRDTGRFGFVLPPVQIIPNCEELMAGMLALVAESKALGYV